jgi:2-polyprenyl-6-methoxyphenol hydroxylase-like FAD-dependent oxidoreductase
MRQDARDILCPAFADVIACTAQPFFQPISDLLSEQLVFGRIALLGDAAFVARPHVGMGVTKAATDAVCLTEALRQAPTHIPDALARYQVDRLEAGRSVVERGRMLGRYMQSQGAYAAPSHNATLLRSSEQVLRQTAVPL